MKGVDLCDRIKSVFLIFMTNEPSTFFLNFFTATVNPFAFGNFAEKRVLKLV